MRNEFYFNPNINLQVLNKKDASTKTVPVTELAIGTERLAIDKIEIKLTSGCY
jgi:hypothetical protein